MGGVSRPRREEREREEGSGRTRRARSSSLLPTSGSGRSSWNSAGEGEVEPLSSETTCCFSLTTAGWAAMVRGAGKGRATADAVVPTEGGRGGYYYSHWPHRRCWRAATSKATSNNTGFGPGLLSGCTPWGRLEGTSVWWQSAAWLAAALVAALARPQGEHIAQAGTPATTREGAVQRCCWPPSRLPDPVRRPRRAFHAVHSPPARLSALCRRRNTRNTPNTCTIHPVHHIHHIHHPPARRSRPLRYARPPGQAHPSGRSVVPEQTACRRR